jgi:hypothetical protein
MDLTYKELLGLFLATPLVIYVAYWNGFRAGKREGWHAGRSISHIPQRHQ